MSSDAECNDIAARIQYWARTKPNDLALLFTTDGENEAGRLTFGELDARARRLSGRILRTGLAAQPVLLLAQSNADFVVAFCGCLYSGAIAVPVPFLGRNRGSARIRSIVQDAGITAAICADHAAGERLQEIIPEISPLAVEGLESEHAEIPSYDPERPALLQYTSGSTSAPKGVIVTHRNLQANIAMLSEAFGVHEVSRVLTWLPLYHDMGLIGNVLPALFCGVPCVVMPPLAFLQRPARWLQAISRYRITISGGPNFAYDLCIRRTDAAVRKSLDLSSWELAVCAAEPVRVSTMRSFADTFAEAGFRANALYPCYGLAEATVFASGGVVGQGVRTLAVGGRELVSCGRPPRLGAATILNPDLLEPVPDGVEGEIWISGDHVASGYWKNESATAATFGATFPGRPEKFLRTGDLGLMREGELYVTGRRKNLIIHQGVNLHSEDVEATVGACHQGFGAVGAAFAVEVNEREEVVVAQEVFNTALESGDVRAMIEKVLDAVADEYGVRLFDLVLLRHGALPRTSSGKVQRDQCRALYLSGELARRAYTSSHPSLGRYQKSAIPPNAP